MITWKIVQLERLISDGFVFKAYWKCSIVDEFLYADESGICSFELSKQTTPFEDLTEEDVLQWVWEKVNKSAVESQLQEKISNLMAPSTELGLPWN